MCPIDGLGSPLSRTFLIHGRAAGRLLLGNCPLILIPVTRFLMDGQSRIKYRL